MVGGMVFGKHRESPEIRLNVAGLKGDQGSYLYTNVVENDDSNEIEVGDVVWWQGKDLLWTPKDKRFTDRIVPRIGYAGELIVEPKSYE